MIRYFGVSKFFGSTPINARESNRYSISIYARRERAIMAVFNAYSLGDAMALVRRLAQRYPSRLIGISRNQYSGKWIAPRYRPVSVPPDYRAFRHLSSYDLISRRHQPRRWSRKAETPNVFQALGVEHSL